MALTISASLRPKTRRSPISSASRELLSGARLSASPIDWAHYADVPFTPLRKPLPQCRVAIITTAAPYQPDKGDQGPGAPYNAAAKFYNVYSGRHDRDPDLRISHVAIDRQHTTARGPGHLFPAGRAAPCGGIGPGRVARAALSWRADQSQPSHHARDGLSGACRALPGRCGRCCHSRRQLPGLPSDGEPCGARSSKRPASPPSSWAAPRTSSNMSACRGLSSPIFRSAMRRAGRTIVRRKMSPSSSRSDFSNRRRRRAPPCKIRLRWSADPSWKLDYSNIDRLSPEEIARRRAEFDRQKTVAKGVREPAGTR